jgi:hypothetical protein
VAILVDSGCPTAMQSSEFWLKKRTFFTALKKLQFCASLDLEKTVTPTNVGVHEWIGKAAQMARC